MPQIEVENLSKVFRVPAKAPGLPGAAAGSHIRSIRIVDGWNFLFDGFFPFDPDAHRLPARMLPSAFIGYYPTLLLLDKMSPPPPLSNLSPPAGRAATAAAGRVWNRCLAACQGTGS
jgi:hypothetical protein